MLFSGDIEYVLAQTGNCHGDLIGLQLSSASHLAKAFKCLWICFCKYTSHLQIYVQIYLACITNGIYLCTKPRLACWWLRVLKSCNYPLVSIWPKASLQFFGSGHTHWQPFWLKNTIITIIIICVLHEQIKYEHIVFEPFKAKLTFDTVDTAVRHYSGRSESIIDSCMIHTQKYLYLASVNIIDLVCLTGAWWLFKYLVVIQMSDWLSIWLPDHHGWTDFHSLSESFVIYEWNKDPDHV